MDYTLRALFAVIKWPYDYHNSKCPILCGGGQYTGGKKEKNYMPIKVSESVRKENF